MEMEIVLPDAIAVMTLPDVAFFPQALLPLHIFEPRYRAMLKDVLATHRLFAIAGLNPRAPGSQFEPPHRIATVGIVRACQKNDNGTSNLLLQGLARVEVQEIIREEPYRFARIRALASEPGAEAEENVRLRTSVARLLTLKQKLDGATTEFTRFLKTVEDPETFIDLAAFSLCDSPAVKQRLLETLDVHERLVIFGQHLRLEIDSLKLRHKLQGQLSDDDIANN